LFCCFFVFFLVEDLLFFCQTPERGPLSALMAVHSAELQTGQTAVLPWVTMGRSTGLEILCDHLGADLSHDLDV